MARAGEGGRPLLADRLLPPVQSALRHPQLASDFGHTQALFGHHLHRLELELRRVLAADFGHRWSPGQGKIHRVLDVHDLWGGSLIREWKADVVIAHRQWGYHPDHRYVG